MRRFLLGSAALAGMMIPQPLNNSVDLLRLNSSSAEANEAPGGKEIKLLVSLLWDGTSVDPVNLESLKTFRTSFSNIPFTHFISPAFFTDKNPETSHNLEAIRSLNRPGDNIGISIAPWKSIVTKSGVIFRSGPTFWGNVPSEINCADDCGNDIPLNIYQPEEVEKIVRESLRVLSANGFPYIRGMHVRGWMATPEILTIASKAGIAYDFSMVTPSIIYHQLRNYPIFAWVKNLWPKGDILSQPGVVSNELSGVVEIPQALGALDYVSHQQMLGFLDSILAVKSKIPMTYHVVLHAETAHINLDKLELVLQGLFKQAAEGKFHLTMMAIPDMEWHVPAAPPVETKDFLNVH